MTDRKPLAEFIAEAQRGIAKAQRGIERGYSHSRSDKHLAEALDRLEALAVENAELRAELAKLTGADHG